VRQLIGVSTGALRLQRDHWHEAITAARCISSAAIELNATPRRMERLMEHVERHPDALDDFDYVSLHAFSPSSVQGWQRLIGRIGDLGDRIHTVVLHPDTLPSDLSFPRSLGAKLAIENMDARKTAGQDITSLRRIFDELPQARLVLDIAHAHACDPSGQLTRDLHDTFAERIAHLHASVIVPATGMHYQPADSDLGWISEAIALTDRPVIWEELPAFC